MPSTNQAGGDTDRLEFPSIRADIGEDPAQWLDRDLLFDADQRNLVMSLIDGIDTIERVRAWRRVERELADDDENDGARNPLDEPRSAIMQRLDQREQWLELNGERPTRLPFGPRQSCDCCDADGFVTAAELRERDQTDVQYSPESAVSAAREQTTEAATIDQFATDGGSDE